jgi:protein SHQ1
LLLFFYRGEPCCESPWNIHKLSSTLSWFDTFTDLPSVLIACCRRTLIYPLIRSFKLAKKCLFDVIEILSKGKRAILQCLLQMRRLFLDEEHRYLLNTLYLNDYCLWIQSDCQTKWLNSLVEAMKHMIKNEFDETNLGLNFEEKTFSWKISLHEASGTDDDDDCSSSSDEENC